MLGTPNQEIIEFLVEHGASIHSGNNRYVSDVRRANFYYLLMLRVHSDPLV